MAGERKQKMKVVKICPIRLGASKITKIKEHLVQVVQKKDFSLE